MAGCFLLLAGGAADAAETEAPPGAAVYRQYCSYCHDDGTLGAPRIGDKAAWAPRLVRSEDALMHNAWNGMGHMLPRRWREDLSEAQFIEAFNYLLDISR